MRADAFAGDSRPRDRGRRLVIEGGDHFTTHGKPEFAAALEEFLRPEKAK